MTFGDFFSGHTDCPFGERERERLSNVSINTRKDEINRRPESDSKSNGESKHTKLGFAFTYGQKLFPYDCGPQCDQMARLFLQFLAIYNN